MWFRRITPQKIQLEFIYKRRTQYANAMTLTLYVADGVKIVSVCKHITAGGEVLWMGRGEVNLQNLKWLNPSLIFTADTSGTALSGSETHTEQPEGEKAKESKRRSSAH